MEAHRIINAACSGGGAAAKCQRSHLDKNLFQILLVKNNSHPNTKLQYTPLITAVVARCLLKTKKLVCWASLNSPGLVRVMFVACRRRRLHCLANVFAFGTHTHAFPTLVPSFSISIHPETAQGEIYIILPGLAQSHARPGAIFPLLLLLQQLSSYFDVSDGLAAAASLAKRKQRNPEV